MIKEVWHPSFRKVFVIPPKYYGYVSEGHQVN
jgi:hypothetical protein